MPAIDRVRIARETYGAYEFGNRAMVEKHLSPEFRFYSRRCRNRPIDLLEAMLAQRGDDRCVRFQADHRPRRGGRGDQLHHPSAHQGAADDFNHTPALRPHASANRPHAAQ